MNQILNTINVKKNKNSIIKLKLQLIISLIIIIILVIYFIYFYVKIKHENKLSSTLLNNFNIERLYSSNKDYTIVEFDKNNNNFFVIGIIEIPKINIKYPILSNISDELLKISSCRFYGPYPNEIGNLCIAAHNYDDNRFFGNLYKLDIGDVINIYDYNNFLVSYYVYDKFEVLENNTSSTSQNTNGKREITLVTCNNFNKNRLIIKAKE